MKKLCAFVLALMMLTGITSAFAVRQASNVRLAGLKGPTTMGFVKLLKDNEEGLTANHYDFTMAATADELTPAFLKGEIDIMAVPANLASVLYNKTKGKVQMLAINTLGVLYITEKGGETIKTVADLKGKTIYSTGKGTTPEMVLAYILKKNGLSISKDVKMEWCSEPAETITRLSADKEGVAMLPQPFATVAMQKVEGLRIALSMEDEWNKVAKDSRLITAAIIVRSEFAKENPEIITAFLKDYQASAEWVNANVADAAALIEAYDIVKAPIAQKALPLCNIVCITGNEMKTAAEGYFTVLFKNNAKSIGEKMPKAAFYHVEP